MKKIAISLALLLLMILATIAIIFYGKGYRIDFNGNSPIVAGTGLLVATSSPDGAQVFINGELATATDNTINLAPGEYEVKIFKDGYFSWQKKITIKNEVVSKADAFLLSTAPKLESITNIGVLKPVLDPTGTKIAYSVASQSATRNGIYVLDMSLRPILTLQSSSTQIAQDFAIAFSEAFLTWSPDSRQILASFLPPLAGDYLLSTGNLNASPTNVTSTLTTVNNSWIKLKEEKQKALMDSLRRPLRTMVSQNFNILEWSDDETKILYTASQSANLPLIITPPLIGTNSTPEERGIKKDSVYVYDIKEDRNYRILDSLPQHEVNSPLPIMWYPDSKHLVYVNDGKIDIMEYDAQNQTTVYAGPFVNGYVFPWPDATKLVILTNLGNPLITPNLYTISLK